MLSFGTGEYKAMMASVSDPWSASSAWKCRPWRSGTLTGVGF
jgi:hypothetical protein